MGPELMTLKDNHDRQLVLSPTHEESVTSLVAGLALSYRSMPLRLYQVGSRRNAFQFIITKTFVRSRPSFATSCTLSGACCAVASS
jgi:hypothetical protein